MCLDSYMCLSTNPSNSFINECMNACVCVCVCVFFYCDSVKMAQLRTKGQETGRVLSEMFSRCHHISINDGPRCFCLHVTESSAHQRGDDGDDGTAQTKQTSASPTSCETLFRQHITPHVTERATASGTCHWPIFVIHVLLPSETMGGGDSHVKAVPWQNRYTLVDVHKCIIPEDWSQMCWLGDSWHGSTYIILALSVYRAFCILRWSRNRCIE